MGVESNAKQNLENLSKNIMEFGIGIQTETAFLSFQTALEYVFRLAEKERLILAIDEYPLLILCGSSMSYMEEHVLAYKAPLYGRHTAQLKILPFDFADTCRYYKNFSPEDNIKNTFLNPTSSLFEEPENLLKQEVREPTLYNAIITAVATGASRMAEISAKVGEDTSVCAAYLKNLMALGLVHKETPYGEKLSRKSIYTIGDNMFRFWYRFVPENSSIIGRGAAELAYRRIEPYLSDYMGKVFEEICKQYLWKLLLKGESPVEFKGLGRWWVTKPSAHSQTEIDIMGEQDKDTALFGECRWTNGKVDVDAMDTLIKRSQLFHYHNVYLYLFAKSGFTKECLFKVQSLSRQSKGISAASIFTGRKKNLQHIGWQR